MTIEQETPFNPTDYRSTFTVEALEPVQPPGELAFVAGYRAVVVRANPQGGSAAVYDSQDENDLILATELAALDHGRAWVDAAVELASLRESARGERRAELPGKLRDATAQVNGLKAKRTALGVEIRELESCQYRWTLDTDEPRVRQTWTGGRFEVVLEPSCWSGELDSKGNPIAPEPTAPSQPKKAQAKAQAKAKAETPIAGQLADALEASDIQPAGPAGPTAALVGAREWSPTTIASLLRAEKARGKPRHRVLDVLDDHPFATRLARAHDPAAVLLLTSSSLTLEQLVGAVEATADIEVVREMLTREQKRTGTTKPREAVLLACEAALERLLGVSP